MQCLYNELQRIVFKVRETGMDHVKKSVQFYTQRSIKVPSQVHISHCREESFISQAIEENSMYLLT